MELIGRRFGHIRVTEVVGSGGMGDVYAGYDEKLERRVALKVLNSDQRLDEEARQRLLREARALSKLEHPNICRIHDYIETGDVDLLVLEYIDGRTLHDAISNDMPRSERLRIAIAIAEVLVRAHRAGIVHRDLKPENVMLTRSGEVKVLDFGLARWLHRARRSGDQRISPVRVPVRSHKSAGDVTMTEAFASASPSDSDSGKREHLATAVGITLGTPIFMSPEQARGETLTPASDMFSFGLLLQSLFTGKDPHPIDLTAREVILRVARGETLPVQGAPGDVTALINRLKQFAPADRPTALETLERLRHLDEKPQRIARRALAAAIAVIVAVGAWRYTVDLRRERAIAVAALKEAEQRRGQAEDLINFMVGDLRVKLEPVGRLDILDDVGERAMAYVQSLNPGNMSATELARNAKVLNQLGEVRLGQGKSPDAMALFDRALALAKQAAAKEPRNAQAQLVLGATHFWIGNGLRLQGNTSQALVHMREYMKTGDALVSIDASNREYQLERAYGHSGVALILEATGNLREALEHYEISRDVKRRLVERDPSNVAAQAELARAFNKVGNVLMLLGELQPARADFEREMNINSRLVAAQPENAEWKHRLANSKAFLANANYYLGRVDEAYALWQEELAIERELTTRDPENVDWQRNVAVTTRWLARALAAKGDLPAALALFRDARGMLQSAIREAPARASWPLDLVSANHDYARALIQAGNRAAAEAVLRESLQLLSRVEPGDRATLEMARAWTMLGEVLRERAPDQALDVWIRAEQTLAPLVARRPEPPRLDAWTRILVHRNRLADARAVMARLRPLGYAPPELVHFCRNSGC